MSTLLRPGTPALILAPMEGVTDAPMRTLLTELGGFDFCVAEFFRVSHMVPQPHLLQQHVPELTQGARTPSGVPVHVQLLGGDASMLAETAQLAVAAGATHIDLNFGCPARTVNRRDGGASLLRYPQRIRNIVSTVRAALPAAVPLSVKLRLGWDDANAVHENTEMAAQGGAAWITIHGRTRMQGYKPPAYWGAMGVIRRRLGLPIVANGEIWTVQDLLRCQEETGCEHFMIGRGALADPSLAQQVAALWQGRRAARLPLPWPSMLRRLVGLAHAANKRPGYLPGRIKQWLKMSHQQFPDVWYDRAKTLHTVDEILGVWD